MERRAARKGPRWPPLVPPQEPIDACHRIVVVITIRLPAAFQRLAWSNLVAQSAEQIGLAAAPLVAVFALGAGARDIGLLQSAQTLPFLLLSIPLGVIADRRSRRTLMALAESVRALAMLCVLLLVITHALSAAAARRCSAFSARRARWPTTSRRLRWCRRWCARASPAANGRLELARSVAYSAGPALGGLLVGWIGAGWAYGCAAGLSAAAAICSRDCANRARRSAATRHFLTELREGARFVGRDALLRPMLATAVFFNIGFFILQSVYVPYAVQRLGLSASAVGVTLGAYGVGMVCGALAAPAVARRIAFGRMLLVGPFCGLAASLVMVGTLAAPSFWLAASSFFLLGAGPILWTVGSTTLRQAITPANMMGRVSALNSTATYGARPLGALLGAAISARFGMGPCLVAAAAGFVVQAWIIAASPAARLVRIPERSAAACRDLKTALSFSMCGVSSKRPFGCRCNQQVRADVFRQLIRSRSARGRRRGFVPPDRDEADLQAKELGHAVEGLDGRIAGAALDVLDDAAADASVRGELGLGQARHLAHRFHGLGNASCRPGRSVHRRRGAARSALHGWVGFDVACGASGG